MVEPIELHELWTYKFKKTKLDNVIEMLFGYGHQEDKFYILQYPEGKRDKGMLSNGMSYKEALELFDKTVKEEDDLGSMLDDIFL